MNTVVKSFLKSNNLIIGENLLAVKEITVKEKTNTIIFIHKLEDKYKVEYVYYINNFIREDLEENYELENISEEKALKIFNDNNAWYEDIIKSES